MAYKNSDGASSIANEWGQWRYFNSALDKLGTAKPATVTINEKNVDIPEAENWMDCFTAVMKGIQGGFEAKKELSYKLADDYLKTHSLEEYRDEMAKGIVPFQDDPLAMARLKEAHGQLAFQYITEDFRRLVDTNKFGELQPEQVDAEFFKFAREQSAGIAKAFGYAENDVFFNRGLFTNSPTERLNMMKRQKEVAHDNSVEKMFVADSAKLTAIAASPDVSADAILNAYNEQSLTTGIYYTPEKHATQLNSVLKVLSNNTSPNAFKTLEDLGDKVLPGSGDVTLRKLLGEDAYRQAKISSLNNKHNADTKAKLDWENSVDRLVVEGNSKAIKAQRDIELEQNGGLLTDKVKYLESSYDKSLKTSAKNLTRAANNLSKSVNENARLEIGKGYWFDAARDSNMMNFASYGITSTDAKVAYDYLVKTGALSEKDQINIARNKSISYQDNPALKFFSQRMSKAVDSFNGWVDAAMDKSYDQIPKKAEDVPEDFTIVMDMYRNNKAVFNEVFGHASKADKDLIATMCVMQDSGISLFDMARSRAKYENDKKEALEGRDLGKLAKVREEVINEVSTSNIGGANGMDRYGKATLYGLLGQAVSLGMSPKEAKAHAETAFNNSFVNFMSTTIPKSFFTNADGDFNDPAYSMFDDFIGDSVLTKDQRGYFSKYYDVGYDRGADVVMVYDKAGYCVRTYSKKDYETYVNNFYEKQRAKDLEKITANAQFNGAFKTQLVNPLYDYPVLN